MKDRYLLAVAALGAVTSTLSPAIAHAQNHRELPIGGRTATMGGAGTAAGNDSAMPYLNPAGLAGVPEDIFAVSAAVYAYTHRSYENLLFPRGLPSNYAIVPGTEDFSTSSVAELPSSVMYFRHLNAADAPVRHKVGISLVIPGARDVSLVASSSGRVRGVGVGNLLAAASTTIQQRRYYLGPSYAVSFGDDVRVGLSLYGVYQRRVESSSFKGQGDLESGATTIRAENASNQVYNSFSLSPVIGVQARLVSKLWAGLGLASPTIYLGGNDRANITYSVRANGVELDTSITGNPAYRDYVPLRVNAGLAWEDRGLFSVALDAQLFLGGPAYETNGVYRWEQRSPGDATRTFFTRGRTSLHSDAVLDIGIGGEIAMTKALSTRVGFFTDVSGVQEFTGTPNEYGQMRLDRFGATFGLGMRLGSFDTTAGVILARGTGQYLGSGLFTATNGGPTYVPIHTTESTAIFVLSGAVTVEEAKRAIREALPFAVPLPDLDLGGKQPPVPWLPQPLPQEQKPPPPHLRRSTSPMIEPPKPVAPAPAPAGGGR